MESTKVGEQLIGSCRPEPLLPATEITEGVVSVSATESYRDSSNLCFFTKSATITNPGTKGAYSRVSTESLCSGSVSKLITDPRGNQSALDVITGAADRCSNLIGKDSAGNFLPTAARLRTLIEGLNKNR